MEIAPGSGLTRLNPGSDAREKLAPVEAEPARMAGARHGRMMSRPAREVK